MKAIHFFTAFVVFPVFAQVSPNSRRFEVKNYIAIDQTGNYHPYFTHGYAEITPNGTRAKLFIMPLLEIDPAKTLDVFFFMS